MALKLSGTKDKQERSRHVLFELLDQKGLRMTPALFLRRLQAFEFRLRWDGQRRERVNLDDVGRIPLQAKESLSHLNLTA